MKVLHTSDWHLGHKLYEHDRHDEQAHMLTQIAKVVQTEQPDALVISGDIYHTSNPSKQTQKLFHDKLLELLLKKASGSRHGRRSLRLGLPS